MAVKWTIETVYYESIDSKAKVISHVRWKDMDSETVDYVVHYGYDTGRVTLDTSDLSSFIAYESVTEANVLAWVKAKLGATRIAAAETKIANQIAEKKAPVSGTKDRSKDGWVP